MILRILSSDSFQGRKPGSIGSAKARAYILKRIKETESIRFDQSFTDTFKLASIEAELPGVNIQALKKGNLESDKLIVISAHYDHLGIKDNEIYNGANDNATGVSVLLNLISELENYESNNSILYLFFDAEEFGKQGVKHFLSSNSNLNNKIILNFNIDMLNCQNESELFLCGTQQFPRIKEILVPTIKHLNINLDCFESTLNMAKEMIIELDKKL